MKTAKMKQTAAAKVILVILFISGWFALIAQFYLIIINRVTSVSETIIRYFSFFTILTNILVVLCVTALLFVHKKSGNTFFTRLTNVTGIAVNIAIVGLVFNIILRSLWDTEGLQWVVNEILHVVTPLFYVIYWLICVPKIKGLLKSVYPWLLYPFCYLLIILALGHYSSYYPYPFIDVVKLGYQQVIINSTGMLLAFLAVLIIFTLINRGKKDKTL